MKKEFMNPEITVKNFEGEQISAAQVSATNVEIAKDELKKKTAKYITTIQIVY